MSQFYRNENESVPLQQSNEIVGSDLRSIQEIQSNIEMNSFNNSMPAKL